MIDTRCIRCIEHRIEAIRAAYRVLAGMHRAYLNAARPGDGSLASDTSGCRLLGLMDQGPLKNWPRVDIIPFPSYYKE